MLSSVAGLSASLIRLLVVVPELSCYITCCFHTRRFGEVGDVFLPKVVSVLLLECKKNGGSGPLLLGLACCSYIYIYIHHMHTGMTLTSQHYTGEPRGFAFVRFIKKDDADSAMNDLNGAEFQGRELRIQFARQPRPNNPREHFMERERRMGGYGASGGSSRGDGGPGYGSGGRGYDGGGGHYRDEGNDRYDRGGRRGGGHYYDDRYDRGGGGGGGRDRYDGGGRTRNDNRYYRGKEGREKNDDRHMASK